MGTDRSMGRRALLLVPLAAMLAVPPSATAQEEEAAVRVGDNQRVVVEDAPEADPVRGLDIPGLAGDPDDADHVVLVAEALLRGECVYRATFNGGATWEGGDLRAPEGFQSPPCLGFDVGGYTHSDGSVAFGSDQNVYTTFSSVREGEGDSILVARSSDGGRSFETATVAIPGGIDGELGPVYQRPKLAVQARPEGDRVYVTAWGGAFLEAEEVPGCGDPCGYRVVVAVSDDGAQTWAEPVDITAPRTPEELVATAPLDIAREQSQPAVGPDGDAFVAWRARFDTETGQDRLMVGISSDGGATWQRQVVGGDDELIVGLSHPKMAVGPDGTVYVVYEADASAEEGADTDIFFQRSTDGGATWSEATRVNDDLEGSPADQSIPQIEVAADGRVDLVWHDARFNYPAPAEINDIVYAYSIDQGQSFSPNLRVTDRTINLDVGLDPRVGTTSFYHPGLAPLADGSVMVAWSDPRQGNFLNGSQDIYVATVGFDPEGPIPVQEVAVETETASVALSQLAYPGGGARVDGRAATKVVVVAEDDVAAALAGGVLARANFGPVLVSGPDGLPEAVEEEVRRLEPVGAYVIGDESVLSAAVLDDLGDAGVPEDQIVRLAGETPAVTAVRVAEAVAEAPTISQDDLEDGIPIPPPFTEVVVVNPESDAAAASANLAAGLRLPVLFVDVDEVPPATSELLAANEVEQSLVIGGPDAVSEEVLGQLPGATRLAGPGPSDTSEAVVAEALARGDPANLVYVADGEATMEAALLGAAVARLGGLLLIAPDADASRASLDDLDLASAVDRLVVVEATSTGRNWLPVVLAVAFVVVAAIFAVVALGRARSAREGTGNG